MPERGFQLFTRSDGKESVCQKLRRQFRGPAFALLCVLVAERTLDLDSILSGGGAGGSGFGSSSSSGFSSGSGGSGGMNPFWSLVRSICSLA